MAMRSVDITVVINAHREGILLAPTFRGAEAARAHAASRGLVVEALVVLDRPSPDTAEFVAGQRLIDAVVLPADVGDLAKARNLGVGQARGRFVAFLDGDDLWCESWLAAAARAATNDPRPVVWHPAMNVYFPESPNLFAHRDMEDPDFDVLALAVENQWTALSFAERRLYERFPFKENRLREGLGFEDWSWNCDTIAGGVLHKIVPETTHFVRRKKVSLMTQTHANDCILNPSPLFRQLIATRRHPDV